MRPASQFLIGKKLLLLGTAIASSEIVRNTRALDPDLDHLPGLSSFEGFCGWLIPHGYIFNLAELQALRDRFIDVTGLVKHFAFRATMNLKSHFLFFLGAAVLASRDDGKLFLFLLRMLSQLTGHRVLLILRGGLTTTSDKLARKRQYLLQWGQSGRQHHSPLLRHGRLDRLEGRLGGRGLLLLLWHD